jgi:lipopolysaccharide transport system ATP-binding protein
MTDIAIRVENLSKQYRIGGPQARYKTIRESLTEAAQAPFRRAAKLLRGQAYGAAEMDQTIWALKDVSFEVERGEVVGIIGRNGAGKTTLLKILSRITEPTEGQAEIHGRVGSLLEVGTGFHPELTGEIDRKFDEIVDFAEIEKFMDTPVKHYSSGMYVRLAFAVAAHLEPEILLVDEVLAVGDSEFQKKCLGKMGAVAKEGRTVLFVSHNMGAVQNLCTRAVLLNEGTVILDDSPRTVVGEYLTMGVRLYGERVWPDMDQSPGDEVARLRAVRVLDRHGKVCTDFDVRDPVSIEMEYWVLRDVDWLDASFGFRNERGEVIFVSVDDSTDSPSGDRKRSAGFHRSTCHIPPDFLNDGQVYVRAALSGETEVHTIQHDVVMFNVGDAMDPKGVRGNYRWNWSPAAVRPRLRWTMEHFPLEPG